jgi:ferrous iron transport protein A
MAIWYEITKMMFDYRIIETDGFLVTNNWCYENKDEAAIALEVFRERVEPIPLNKLSRRSLPNKVEATVESVSGRSGERLLDLGFLPGTVIRVEGQAPLCDPLSYYVRGATICLRAVEAAGILVREVVEPEGWFRHIESGRRRPEGNADKEYINW